MAQDDQLTLEDFGITPEVAQQFQQETGVAVPAIGQPEPQGAPTEPPQEMAELSLDDFGVTSDDIKKMTNPATGELRPAAFDGSSPDTAINKSPLDIADRGKISLGNVPGSLKFLKGKFEDAALRKDGKFAVLDDGVWKIHDQKGLGDASPWEITRGALKANTALALFASNPSSLLTGLPQQIATDDPVTKEIVSDIADVSKELGLIGATVSTGGVGGAVAAAMGASGGLTSLGRLVGTYEGTAEDQLKESSIEGALTLLGLKFLPGVAATGKRIGQELIKKAAPITKTMSQGAKKFIANTLGAMSGAGDQTIMRTYTRPKEIGRRLVEAASKSKTDSDAIELLAKENVGLTRRLALRSRQALSDLYDTTIDAIRKKVPANFRAPVHSSIDDVYRAAVKNNLGAVDDLGNFALKSRQELLSEGQLRGGVPEFAQNKKAYKLLKDYFGALADQRKVSLQSGSKALDQLKEVDQLVGGLSRRLRGKALDQGFDDTARIFQAGKQVFEDSLERQMARQLAGTEALAQYRALKTQYRNVADKTEPFLTALSGGIKRGKTTPFQTLMNKLMANKGRNPVEKQALDTIANTLGKFDPRLVRLSNRIQDNAAASGLMPQIREGFVQFGLAGEAASLIFGAPGASMFIGGLLASTSPRLIGLATRGAGRASGGMLRFANFLRHLPQSDLQKLAGNEQALRTLLISASQIPNEQSIVEQVEAASQQGAPQ